MADDGAITAAQRDAARATPVLPAAFRRPAPIPGSDYFAEDVRRWLVDKFGADETTQGGLIVRTSLDPDLQAQAERVLRAGLLAYDRSHGGWRGPVGHLDAVGHDWPAALAAAKPPAGMLAEWRLAVVLSTTEGSARVGWLENIPPPGRVDAPPAQPQAGTITLASIGWARPVHDGHPGAAPHRMDEVMQVATWSWCSPGPGRD